jgi:hypothetical protein
MNDTALTGQFTIAILVPIVFQWIKIRKWFPWITVETQKLNRVVGVAVAFAASIGVVVGFDRTAGVLTVTGLTLAGLSHGVWRFVQQWAFQQASYKLIIAPPMPGAMQAGAEKHPPVLAVEPDPSTDKQGNPK